MEVPLYESRVKYLPLYIHEGLFQWYFQDSNTDFEHMASVIQAHFSTTINPDKSNGKRVGSAYVDLQADPLKISLNDNLGSGRAFYQDDIFNIKGEKTPLAKSEREQYSNGILELEKAISETISSNSLYLDVDIQLAPILAVLDIQEICRVPWKDMVCKRAKVIRMDLDGSLDRITHIFQARRQMPRKALLSTARKMGVQEGEKFLQRIQHGAWSAGNISEHAHMIDFDTVCATRYRAPQYSFTKWFIDNYFGLEYRGQLKILKSLVADREINTDRVSYPVLKRELMQARMRHIEQNFSGLMGFGKVHAKYQPAIRRLVKKFIRLSMRCYPDPLHLSLKYLPSQYCSPFNFSKFFRYYPILRRSGAWEAYLGLEYLVDCVKKVRPFDLKAVVSQNEDERFFNTTVLKRLDAYFLHSEEELLALTAACLAFIQEYDKLYSRILADTPKAQGRVERRAYVMNQDRLHLFKPHSMAGPIDDEKYHLSSERIHRVIQATIQSNQRSGAVKLGGLSLSNMEIFKEGYFATLHNDAQQHRLSLNFFGDGAHLGSGAGYRIKVNGQFYDCRVRREGGVVSVQSPLFDNLNLLEQGYGEIVFYAGGDMVVLNPFMFSFTDSEQIHDFAALVYTR